MGFPSNWPIPLGTDCCWSRRHCTELRGPQKRRADSDHRLDRERSHTGPQYRTFCVHHVCSFFSWILLFEPCIYYCTAQLASSSRRPSPPENSGDGEGGKTDEGKKERKRASEGKQLAGGFRRSLIDHLRARNYYRKRGARRREVLLAFSLARSAAETPHWPRVKVVGAVAS